VEEVEVVGEPATPEPAIPGTSPEPPVALEGSELEEEVAVNSPKVNTSELLLLGSPLMLVVPVLVAVTSTNDPVAIIVPLIIEISSVDVAVTVTVWSSLVEAPVLVKVPFDESERADPTEPRPEEDVVDVKGGVVIVPCDESVLLVEIPGTVSEPTSDRETTVPDVAAGTSVTLEVVVPSLTLISTTLEVTVASGARGRR